MKTLKALVKLDKLLGDLVVTMAEVDEFRREEDRSEEADNFVAAVSLKMRQVRKYWDATKRHCKQGEVQMSLFGDDAEVEPEEEDEEPKKPATTPGPGSEQRVASES
jgi:hypothetical protein